MAITRVQSKTANTAATNAGSLSVVLDAAPTNGNILILVVCCTSPLALMTTTADIAWSNPSTKSNGSNASVQTFIGYVRTGSASATLTPTLTSGTQPIAAVCAEYSGLSEARFDTTAGTSGTGTSLASGATTTSRTAVELWIGAQSNRSNGAATFSAPTNSFAIVAQTGTTNTGANLDRTVALLEKIVSSTGTANSGVTSDQSTTWVSATVTFDATPTVGQTSGIYG